MQHKVISKMTPAPIISEAVDNALNHTDARSSELLMAPLPEATCKRISAAIATDNLSLLELANIIWATAPADRSGKPTAVILARVLQLQCADIAVALLSRYQDMSTGPLKMFVDVSDLYHHLVNMGNLGLKYEGVEKMGEAVMQAWWKHLAERIPEGSPMADEVKGFATSLGSCMEWYKGKDPIPTKSEMQGEPPPRVLELLKLLGLMPSDAQGGSTDQGPEQQPEAAAAGCDGKGGCHGKGSCHKAKSAGAALVSSSADAAKIKALLKKSVKPEVAAKKAAAKRGPGRPRKSSKR